MNTTDLLNRLEKILKTYSKIDKAIDLVPFLSEIDSSSDNLQLFKELVQGLSEGIDNKNGGYYADLQDFRNQSFSLLKYYFGKFWYVYRSPGFLSYHKTWDSPAHAKFIATAYARGFIKDYNSDLPRLCCYHELTEKHVELVQYLKEYIKECYFQTLFGSINQVDSGFEDFMDEAESGIYDIDSDQSIFELYKYPNDDLLDFLFENSSTQFDPSFYSKVTEIVSEHCRKEFSELLLFHALSFYGNSWISNYPERLVTHKETIGLQEFSTANKIMVHNHRSGNPLLTNINCIPAINELFLKQDKQEELITYLAARLNERYSLDKEVKNSVISRQRDANKKYVLSDFLNIEEDQKAAFTNFLQKELTGCRGKRIALWINALYSYRLENNRTLIDHPVKKDVIEAIKSALGDIGTSQGIYKYLKDRKLETHPDSQVNRIMSIIVGYFNKQLINKS